MSKLSPRDLRHNLRLNCLHEFTWGFGFAFHTVYAIAPLFMKKLGAPPAVVASLAGLFYILISIPQFFAAVLGRNIKNIKLAAIGIHMLTLPSMFIAGYTFTFLSPSGSSAWMFYYICFILYGLSIGFVIPIWAGFLRHATDNATRGSFFGISFAFTSVGGFIGGILVKMLLSSSVPFPNNFGWGFLILTGSMAFGAMLFIWFRLDSSVEVQPHRTVKQFFKEVKTIFQTRQNFRRYLLARIFFTFNYPAVSLYAVYGQDKFSFDISEAGIFTILTATAFGVASYTSGKIGDRFGHKTSLVLSFIAHILAILTAISAQSMIWVYGIFVFLGIGQGAFMPASMNLVYDFAGEKGDNKLFMAMIDTTLAPFTLIAIIFAGILAETVATVWIFLAVAGFLLIGLLLMIFRVKDPNHKPHESPVYLEPKV